MEHHKSKIHGRIAVVILMRIAGYDQQLGNAARRILMIIAGHTDSNSECFPSIKRIAQELEVSRQAVRKQIIILEKLGYLEVRHTFTEQGGQTSNTYRLNEQMARDYVGK